MKKDTMHTKNIGQILQSKTKNKIKRSGKITEKRKKMIRKFKKFFKIISILLTIIIILSIVSILLIDYRVEKTGKNYLLSIDKLEKGDMLATDLLDKDYDCVIVPGAMVYQNSTPSAMLQDRLDIAFELYSNKIVKKILVSGDHETKYYDEVNTMRKYLLDKGVPSEDIFMDPAGLDTYQTIYRARDIFKVKKALIATQDFHLYRALYIGEKLSVDLHGVDSALRNYQNSLWNRSREYLARVKAFIECEIIKPLPKYLGEEFPISGDGNLTVDNKIIYSE